MVLWYAGLAAVVVWAVFRDPRVDFRMLAVGALVPDALDAVVSGERAFAHTLAVPVATLFGVVLLTAGRRPARSRLLMVPIGMLLHLALDGMWSHPETFWWPLLGGSVHDGALLPSTGVVVVRELVGAAAVWWFVQRFSLSEPAARRRFVRTGRVEVAEP